MTDYYSPKFLRSKLWIFKSTFHYLCDSISLNSKSDAKKGP